MHILLLTTHLNRGGIGRYCIILAKALKARGHTVTVASSGGEWIEHLRAVGIIHISIPIQTKFFLSFKVWQSFLKLRPLIKREKIDIVHCNTRVTQMVGFLIKRHCKIPSLSAFHGFYTPKLSRKLIRLSGRRAIAVSNAVAKHLIGDLRIPQEKVRVVYNGIDLQEFPQQLISPSERQEKKTKAGFSTNDFIVGIRGRISEEKGHFVTLEAFEILASRFPQVHLVFSGKGKLREKLRQAIRTSGLNSRITISEWTLQEFFNILDVLLIPSQKEGFGYTILEAFAMGVPVIGFNVGGISELIRDRENGLLFNRYTPTALAAALEKVITHPDLRKKMQEEGRKTVITFSAEAMAINTEKIYNEVLV